MADLGKLLLITGGIIALIGLILVLGVRVPLLGRLPGDISFTRGNVHFYFPLVTGLLLSLLATLILNFLIRR